MTYIYDMVKELTIRSLEEKSGHTGAGLAGSRCILKTGALAVSK